MFSRNINVCSILRLICLETWLVSIAAGHQGSHVRLHNHLLVLSTGGTRTVTFGSKMVDHFDRSERGYADFGFL